MGVKKKTITKVESREEGEKAFAEGVGICDAFWLSHSKCLTQVRRINPLDRPCVPMEEGKALKTRP